MFRALLVWLLRAWPLLAIAPVFAVHLLALALLPQYDIMVNRLAGTAMQIVGGLIVLDSVDSNLGLFRKKSLASLAITWFRDFPLNRRAVTISLTGVASSAAFGTATASVTRAATTLEERLAEVERQLEEVRAAMHRQDEALNRRIEKVQSELSQSMVANQSSIRELATRIEAATVGGFKQQAFGVLLAIYGAVTSVFA